MFPAKCDLVESKAVIQIRCLAVFNQAARTASRRLSTCHSNKGARSVRKFVTSAIRQIIPKLCAALVVAIILAVASGSSLKLGIRYFAGASFLVSVSLAVMAILRKPDTEGALSDWQQAILFSVIAAVAHLAGS